MEDFFFSEDRIFKPGPIRAIYFLLFAFFFLLTELYRQYYRPYIYHNGIDDFGFADVIGNLLGTVAIIFFNLAAVHATRIQSIRIILFMTVGVMIYELLQAILPRGVLDWKDVFSTPIAGLFSLMLVLLIWRVVEDPLSVNEERMVDKGHAS